MIVVITHKERIEKTNRYETLVSHGIDLETDETVILPQVPINCLSDKVVFNYQLGEYVIHDHIRTD